MTADWKNITYANLSKYDLSWNNTLEVKFNSKLKWNLNDKLGDQTKAKLPILDIAVDKTPMYSSGGTTEFATNWTPTAANSVTLNFSSKANSVQAAALYNAQNANALTIKEVSIATDNPLTVNETRGSVFKPVGTTNFTDSNSGADDHTYTYRYSIGK